jgi:hypothetical protein
VSTVQNRKSSSIELQSLTHRWVFTPGALWASVSYATYPNDEPLPYTISSGATALVDYEFLGSTATGSIYLQAAAAGIVRDTGHPFAISQVTRPGTLYITVDGGPPPPYTVVDPQIDVVLLQLCKDNVAGYVLRKDGTGQTHVVIAVSFVVRNIGSVTFHIPSVLLTRMNDPTSLLDPGVAVPLLRPRSMVGSPSNLQIGETPQQEVSFVSLEAAAVVPETYTGSLGNVADRLELTAGTSVAVRCMYSLRPDGVGMSTGGGFATILCRSSNTEGPSVDRLEFRALSFAVPVDEVTYRNGVLDSITADASANNVQYSVRSGIYQLTIIGNPFLYLIDPEAKLGVWACELSVFDGRAAYFYAGSPTGYASEEAASAAIASPVTFDIPASTVPGAFIDISVSVSPRLGAEVAFTHSATVATTAFYLRRVGDSGSIPTCTPNNENISLELVRIEPVNATTGLLVDGADLISPADNANQFRIVWRLTNNDECPQELLFNGNPTMPYWNPGGITQEVPLAAGLLQGPIVAAESTGDTITLVAATSVPYWSKTPAVLAPRESYDFSSVYSFPDGRYTNYSSANRQLPVSVGATYSVQGTVVTSKRGVQTARKSFTVGRRFWDSCELTVAPTFVAISPYTPAYPNVRTVRFSFVITNIGAHHQHINYTVYQGTPGFVSTALDVPIVGFQLSDKNWFMTTTSTLKSPFGDPIFDRTIPLNPWRKSAYLAPNDKIGPVVADYVFYNNASIPPGRICAYQMHVYCRDLYGTSVLAYRFTGTFTAT